MQHIIRQPLQQEYLPASAGVLRSQLVVDGLLMYAAGGVMGRVSECSLTILRLFVFTLSFSVVNRHNEQGVQLQ